MIRRFRPVLFASILYGLLTTLLTWPLLLHLGSVVPNDLGDPLLNTWLMAWNARTLPFTETWWNAPQFYPVRGVLAFSEHLLGLSVITTPLIRATGNALLAYNASFILSFPLCALSAYFLAYTLARRHDVALVAGLAYAFAPYRMAQFAHVQVMSPYWAPVAIAGLHRYFDSGRSRWLVVFAGAWAMQALTCGYYLFYLSVLIGLWLAWYSSRREHWRSGLRVLTAWAVAAAALAPILYGYWKYQRAQGMMRTLDEIEHFSADLASLFSAPDNLWVWRWLNVFDRPESALFPGVTIVILIVVALLIVLPQERIDPRRLRNPRLAGAGAFACAILALSPALLGPWKLQVAGVRLLSMSSADKGLAVALVLLATAAATHPGVRALWRRRSPLAFYVLAAVVMWLCSLGPNPTLMNVPIRAPAPYGWLMWLPGLDGVRVPARFWMLAVLCLSVAAALALRRVASRWPRVETVLPVIACVGILADGWPRPLTLQPPPDPRPNHADAVLRLELPVDAWHDLTVLYRSIEHRTPLLNGYSGYPPRHYDVLRYLLDHRDPEILTRLSAWGTLEVVIDDQDDPGGAWRAFVAAHPGAQLVHRDAMYSSYRIPSSAASVAPPKATGSRLTVAAITAYDKAAPIDAMLDGDFVTRWHSGRPQQPMDALTVDLGQVREVTGAEMSLGTYVIDFPRVLRIDTSTDGQGWTEVWRGGGAMPAFLAALDDPLTVTLSFAIAPRSARYVRFTEMATEPTYYWSIAELRVLGK